MEEIRPRDYARSYCIFKVVSIDTTKDGKYYRGDIPEWIGAWEEDIKSYSPNVIDLIEVGDFVNRREVIGKFIEDGKIVLVLDTKLDTKFIKNKVYEEDIKDIVTHEQFNSMKYIVGGKEE